ncbi:aspartyl protease family protein [Candidatus Poribacteria bacterium]
MLDTGASMCIISPELAKKLQIELGESGVARGRTDRKEYRSSRVETLVVGAVQCSNLRVIVMDCSHVSESVKSHVDGYLGNSFLKEFEVTINYPEQTLVFQ